MHIFLAAFLTVWSASGNLFLAAQIGCYITWSIQEGRLLRYREFSRRLDDAVCEWLIESRGRVLLSIQEIWKRLVARIRGGKEK
jgi:hypothetical protein